MFFARFTSLITLSLICLIPVVAQTPLQINGRLHLEGNQLSNECGNPVQLRGMSTHGVQWFPSCIRDGALTAMRDEWGADIVRLAMYVESGGYLNNPSYWRSWIDERVQTIEGMGMYAIIDWHILSDGDPWDNIDAARTFWDYMSEKHKGRKNVIYEICNEPNGSGIDWPRIKSYAEDIIPRIRANDPEAIIVVGTPTWSGTPWNVVGNELTGDLAYNVMYTFHFYSGTHGGRVDDLQRVLDDVPIFATEWGTSSASGDGGFNKPVTDAFMNVFNGDNDGNVLVSWCNWSFADKDEVSAALTPGSCGGSRWTSTSQSGTLVKFHMSNPADNFIACSDEPNVVIQPKPVTVNQGGQATFSVTASGDNLSYQWFFGGQAIDGATSNEWVINSAQAADEGQYFVRVSNSFGFIDSDEAGLDVLLPGAFNGSPAQIPGLIEAEEYNVGNNGVAYNDLTDGNNGSAFREDDVDVEIAEDASGGFNVGWIQTGEWLKYAVQVTETGTYDIDFRVASNTTGGAFYLEFDGDNVTGTKTVANTEGWQNWETITVEDIELEVGTYEMRFVVTSGGFNLNWMDIQLNAVGIPEVFSDKGLHVVPNPVDDVISIRNEGELQIQGWQMTDLTGVVLFQGVFSASEGINTSELSKGVFVLTVFTPEGPIATRIFKE